MQAKELQIEQDRAAMIDLERKLAQFRQALEGERASAQEKLAVLDEAHKKLAHAFKALAAEALQSNNQSFLELAKTNLETFQQGAKDDLDKRQLAIDELVKPVKESLEKVDAKIQDLEKAREGAIRDSASRWRRSWTRRRTSAAKPPTWSRPCARPSSADDGAKSSLSGSSRWPA